MTFRRPRRGEGRAFLGVCAGLARRWDLEPRTVRLALALTLVPFGIGLLVYAALALVMPADGASEAEAGWRGEIGRSIAEALLVLGAVFGVGVVVAVGTGLALFGLAGVALLLATAALTAVIVIDHPRAWVLGALSLVLAVPAAVVELTDVSVARQAGDLRVAITRPQDARPAGYRAGLGSLLLDLRDFDAEERTTTTIRARSDLRGFVVALPTDRCFNLEVDYALDRTWLLRAADLAGRRAIVMPSALGYEQRFVRPADGRGPSMPVEGTLVAYGRSYPGDAGRYRRPVADPDAPTIRLELQSGRTQIRVRDYPLSVDPLGEQEWPDTSMPPKPLDEIAEIVGLTDPTAELAARGSVVALDPKTGQLRATGRTANGKLNDALAALRDRREYPAEQARKLAGACAAPGVVSAIRKRLRKEQDAELRAYLRTTGTSRPRSTGRSGLEALIEYEAGLTRLLETLSDRNASSAQTKGTRQTLVRPQATQP